MRSPLHRSLILLTLFAALGTAVALGRSSLMQHWLARSDGFVVVVEEPSRVLSAKTGDTVPVEFRLTNVTSEPVEVLGIRTGCGCTAAKPIPCTIAPHTTEIVTLTVSMQNRSPGEPFEMWPELYLDRPARKFGMLIRVNVIP